MYVYVSVGMCHGVYMPPTYLIRGHQNTAGGGGIRFFPSTVGTGTKLRHLGLQGNHLASPCIF